MVNLDFVLHSLFRHSWKVFEVACLTQSPLIIEDRPRLTLCLTLVFSNARGDK